MLFRLSLSVLAAVALAAPAVAQDEAALIGGYLYQLSDTGLAASLTLSGTKFFKDPDLH